MIYQPIIKDAHGTLRFKTNGLVEFLLKHGGIDMNTLARAEFTDEDRMQFAMLIGYSVSGFGSLSYVTDTVYATACQLAGTTQTSEQIELALLREQLKEVREYTAKLTLALFQVHPNDFRSK